MIKRFEDFLSELTKNKRIWLLALLGVMLAGSAGFLFGYRQGRLAGSGGIQTQVIPQTGSGTSTTEAALPQEESEGTAGGGRRVFLPVAVRTDLFFGPAGTQVRPYTPNSVWNTPIGQNPEYDPYSSQMVATIGNEGEGKITSDPNQYSYPVYYADTRTPRWNIPCLRYKCTVVTRDGVMTTDVLKSVPIPPEARPSVGTDGQMIVIDTTSNTEYDLYEVTRTSSGWSVSNASVYNTSWDGAPQRYGSRGAGVPYLAGLVRPWEIIQGEIEHAIAFAYPYPVEGVCVFPASKTDGKSSDPYAIPEGARLQLDPNLTEADFDKMGLNRTGKIIARALQKYGMIVIDNSGRAKIYVEDLKNNPFSPLQWSDPRLNLTSSTIANIPYQSFRVLKLPGQYWGDRGASSLHGKCLTDGN